MTERYDVAILGGGPAGSVCARALARLGHSVVLLAEDRPHRWRAGESCGPSLQRTLARTCGLELSPRGGEPLTYFRSSWGSADLDWRNFGFWHAAPGLVLNRESFDKSLQQAAEASGVAVLRDCRAAACRRVGTSWCIGGHHGTHGLSLQADFIVEATGSAARSPACAGARRYFFDDLVCLSVELDRHPSMSNTAMVESCAQGWWYAAPIAAGRQIVALFTDADFVAAHSQRQLMRAQLAATRHFRDIACIEDHGKIRVSNARTSIRNVLWRGAWLAVGDAAWSLDPLSGSGVERAVADGAAAAVVLSKALKDRDTEPLRAHAHARASAFRDSLVAQKHYYAKERRWTDQPFWSRRAVSQDPRISTDRNFRETRTGQDLQFA